jgi:hypothetical protein
LLKRVIDAMIREQLSRQRIGLFGVELAHVLRVAVLPFHHWDPFDRLIVAQALVEGIPVAGASPCRSVAGDPVAWCHAAFWKPVSGRTELSCNLLNH